VKVVNVVDWKFYQHNQLNQVVEVYKVSKVDVVHVMNEVENSYVDVLMMIGDENDFENWLEVEKDLVVMVDVDVGVVKNVHHEDEWKV